MTKKLLLRTLLCAQHCALASLVTTAAAYWCPDILHVSSVAAANPLISLPSGDFSCSVEVSPHTVPKPDPAFPERRTSAVLKRIVIVQVGKVRRDVSHWSDNSVSELWSLTDKGVGLYQSNTYNRDVYLLRGDLKNEACPPLLRFDAESVSWITVQSLNPETAGAGALKHYRAEVVVSKAEGNIPAVTALYQAWIDPTTLQPAKYDDGENLYVLSFGSAPAAPVMPEKIRAELIRWQEKAFPKAHR
ncbi:MAG: hypothetical protein ACAI35_23765 [Candidatus Methylacidiphilales bacterium]|nr:hypothetical protein [Candidatus Methylacidiphilales bacterium]